MRYFLALLLLTLSNIGNAQSDTEFLDLVALSIKAVVQVVVEMPIKVIETTLPPGMGVPNKKNKTPEDEPNPMYASGTGFIIDGGYIITNYHVIDEGVEIRLFFEGIRNPIYATVLAADEEVDIAVLVTEEKLPDNIIPLKWTNTVVRRGQDIWILGHPNGLDFTFSKGHVSHTDRRIFSEWQRNIQVDALIDHGNSGGPVFNMDGEVVGISSAIMSKVDTFTGVGIAIHHTLAEDAVMKLIRYGEIIRPMMGIIIGYDPDLRVVTADKVQPGSPGEKAGMQDGDQILKLDGHPIIKMGDVFDVLMERAPGDVAIMTVSRNDKILELPITFTKRPPVIADSMPQEPVESK